MICHLNINKIRLPIATVVGILFIVLSLLLDYSHWIALNIYAGIYTRSYRNTYQATRGFFWAWISLICIYTCSFVQGRSSNYLPVHFLSTIGID